MASNVAIAGKLEVISSDYSHSHVLCFHQLTRHHLVWMVDSGWLMMIGGCSACILLWYCLSTGCHRRLVQARCCQTGTPGSCGRDTRTGVPRVPP